MDTAVQDFYRRHLVARALQQTVWEPGDEKTLEQICTIYRLVKRPPTKWSKNEWQKALKPLENLPDWISLPDEISSFVVRIALGKIHPRRGRPKRDFDQAEPIMAIFHFLRLLQRAKLWCPNHASKTEPAPREIAANNALLIGRKLGLPVLWAETTLVKMASSPGGRAIKDKTYAALAQMAA